MRKRIFTLLAALCLLLCLLPTAAFASTDRQQNRREPQLQF